MSNMIKRIGILGGGFDPIHYGHLTAAECVRHELDLDYILFIPTGRPPHKETATFQEHRYLMTALAIADNDRFRITRMELDRPGPSYTVDTLRALKEQAEKEGADTELFFIIGADEMLQISNWKDSHLLPDLCKWVSVTRPGYNADGDLLEIPGLDISGTALRKRVKSGASLRYLTPPSVERYIRELDIYNTSYEELHKSVSTHLSEKRYRHTLGVIETSVLLAARYGANLRKAYLAALLHDYAKEFEEDKKRELCREFALPVDSVQDGFINLMHGPLSAEFTRRKFGIDDPEILDAIRFHTTGRAKMSLLERIIKIADNIEPNRKDYPGLDDIRRLSEADLPDLRKSTAKAIRRDIEYTEGMGRVIHPLGREALEDLEGKN